jgi:anaerobic selenocysteine-containing dehydrogenase
MQQPVVRPLFDTSSFPDVLLTVGNELGGAVRAALPWRTFQDLLQETASGLQQEQRGSVRAPDPERFWISLLQQGGWWDESRTQTATGAASGQGFPSTIRPPRYEGSESDFPFHLLAFPHPFLGGGEAAHVPWLQGLPEPMTSVAWQSWVDVNPKLAQQQGLREGDVIGVESPTGRVDVPVYLNPAAPPTVLAIPMGQGHTTGGPNTTRDGTQRGVNVLALVAPLTDEATGTLAYGATRVRIIKTGRRVQLPKFEGTVPAFQVPHEEVIRVTRES